LRSTCCFSRRLNRGQEQCDQYADDGNDDHLKAYGKLLPERHVRMLWQHQR
jgi:hypothetical protein